MQEKWKRVCALHPEKSKTDVFQRGAPEIGPDQCKHVHNEAESRALSALDLKFQRGFVLISLPESANPTDSSRVTEPVATRN